MKKRKPTFPIIVCDAHPGLREPGYLVCPHVLAHTAAVAHFALATSETLGEVLCEKCIGVREDLYDQGFRCCCAHAIRDEGWDRATQ